MDPSTIEDTSLSKLGSRSIEAYFASYAAALMQESVAKVERGGGVDCFRFVHCAPLSTTRRNFYVVPLISWQASDFPFLCVCFCFGDGATVRYVLKCFAPTQCVSDQFGVGYGVTHPSGENAGSTS